MEIEAKDRTNVPYYAQYVTMYSKTVRNVNNKPILASFFIKDERKLPLYFVVAGTIVICTHPPPWPSPKGNLKFGCEGGQGGVET